MSNASLHRVIRGSLAACAVAALGLPAAAIATPPTRGITLQPLASIVTSTLEGATAAEIVAYDPATRRAFAINSQENDLIVLDLARLGTAGDPTGPNGATVLAKLSFDAFGAGLNGVAVKDGVVAVAVEAAAKTDPGKVVLFRAKDANLEHAVAYTVGALPDMVRFTDNGRWLLVANEGEPNSYGLPDSVNPEGTVSILDLRRGIHRATVATAGFSGFNSQLAALRSAGVRIFGPGATVAQDLEPEYITTEGRTAWVTLQEANAVAVIDIPSASVTTIVPLGRKNHALPGNGLDPSDRDRVVVNGVVTNDGVNIANWPVFGLYQPDAIASYRARDGQVYLITANEGDARAPDVAPPFSEESTVGSGSYLLDPDSFDAATIARLKTNANLGRLTVTTVDGDTDGDGLFNEIVAFGARSFSVWSASGDLVWDSGDQLEQFFAAPERRAIFNANNSTPAAADNRSDNKGPEPEGVAIGRVGGRNYAFVGLERVGGVIAYDVTDPAAPTYAAYANTREADRGPEGVTFVPRSGSPTCRPLVLVGNETSRTLAIYEVVRDREPRWLARCSERDDD